MHFYFFLLKYLLFLIYLDNKYENSIESQASRKMFDMAGIKYRPFEGKVIKISKGE